MVKRDSGIAQRCVPYANNSAVNIFEHAEIVCI